jgi:dTDP-4-amino-4,6-dideoxygalactose transaminase
VRVIPFGKPIIGDEEKGAVQGVLSGTVLVHGPKALDFEREFALLTKAPFAVAVSSCTAAMHLFYFNLGLKKGDEVIVPAQTHTSTAHAVEVMGAKPVFVDADEQTGNIDIDQIEDSITERTRAISVVHFLGMPVDMKRVTAISHKHGIPVLEDCALATGSKLDGIHAGLFGECGCFSFYPVKHITTGEGGMLITKNEMIARQISSKKAFGIDRHHGERALPGVYDVETLGLNYRMSEIQAAIGIEQLKRVEGFLRIRKENYDELAKGLSELDEIDLLDSSHDSFESSYYCLSIILKDKIAGKRASIVSYLKENGIGTSVYYPKPVPHMQYYSAKYGYDQESFPRAARISYSSIALPVGPHLNIDDMQYMVDGVKKALREVM